MITRVYLIIATVLFGMLFTSCDEYFETDCFADCYQQVIISANEYQNAPDDYLKIDSAQMDGDCLTIKFSASGCDGNTWEVKLIDSDVIMESYPPQRNLRLSLKNIEGCTAVITKQVVFNLINLRLKYDKIILNITNSGDQVLYDY